MLCISAPEGLESGPQGRQQPASSRPRAVPVLSQMLPDQGRPLVQVDRVAGTKAPRRPVLGVGRGQSDESVTRRWQGYHKTFRTGVLKAVL